MERTKFIFHFKAIPSFLEVVYTRLKSEITDPELRTMCLQVMISALWCNTDVVLRTFDSVAMSQNGVSIFLDFLNRWLTDIESFTG